MSELSKSVEARLIQVFYNGEAIGITTNATKWSEVVPLIENNESGWPISGKKAVLGSSKGVLQLPDALIPAGNQSIFLVQDKMKSGVVVKKAVKAKESTNTLDSMPYVDLRRLARDKGVAEGLGSNPSRAALIKAIDGKTGIKEVKGISKVAKEKREKINTEVKQKAKELTPDLETRVLALETMLGSLVEGAGEVLDTLRGKRNTIKEAKALDTSGGYMTFIPDKIETKVKSLSELQKEFNSLGL